MDTAVMDDLLSLIGRTLIYRGEKCTIIELLHSENTLVLQCDRCQPTIQANQFGDASRRAPGYHSLPVFVEHGALNPVIGTWLGEIKGLD
jgi:hypothetical protein